MNYNHLYVAGYSIYPQTKAVLLFGFQTHFNPCFCQSSLDDSPQPLDRNQWHTLKDGDIVSLLPGKYMYKVVAVDGDNGTLRYFCTEND